MGIRLFLYHLHSLLLDQRGPDQTFCNFSILYIQKVVIGFSTVLILIAVFGNAFFSNVWSRCVGKGIFIYYLKCSLKRWRKVN